MSGDWVVVQALPKCDVCASWGFKKEIPDALYDCMIPAMRSWGNVCEEHFESEGCSLGSGRGQKLVLSTDTKEIKLMQQVDEQKQKVKGAARQELLDLLGGGEEAEMELRDWEDML